MSAKALRTQLLGAIAMVLVAAIALGSSTFAWFAANQTVNATGMKVRTQVSDNLLIAPSTTGETAVANENTFKTVYVADIDGLLEPVSTIDGVDYFYNSTSNTQADGNAFDDTYIQYVHGQVSTAQNKNAFDVNYNTLGAVGYVDYAFDLKATNSDATASKNVNITDFNLTYGGTSETQKAFRTAMFVYDRGETGTTAAGAPAADKLVSITRVSGAQYFGTYNSHNNTYNAENMGVDAVSGANALVSIANDKIDQNLRIGTVAAGKTNYYKVIIRLWLEGEDQTCNNTTFANLKDKWALDITIKLGDDASVKQYIIPAVATAGKANLYDNNIVTAIANDPTVVAGANYYRITANLTGTALEGKTLYSSTQTITENSRIFYLDSESAPAHVYEVTNQCVLVVPNP